MHNIMVQPNMIFSYLIFFERNPKLDINVVMTNMSLRIPCIMIIPYHVNVQIYFMSEHLNSKNHAHTLNHKISCYVISNLGLGYMILKRIELKRILLVHAIFEMGVGLDRCG